MFASILLHISIDTQVLVIVIEAWHLFARQPHTHTHTVCEVYCIEMQCI